MVATAQYHRRMSPSFLSRFWDVLPRLAALIACVLMLWPLAQRLVERTARETGHPASKPVATSFKVSKSEIHVDASAAYWAVVVTVQSRQPERYPRPRLLAIIRDIEGNEVFREQMADSYDPTEPDAEGVRIWTLRMEHPRTLSAERYHTLTTSLINDQ